MTHMLYTCIARHICLAKTQAGLVHDLLLQVVMMGFSMGGYVAAAFAATHPDLVAGVVMGACAHDAHTTTWKLVGYMSQAVYAVCSHKTKSQVRHQGSAWTEQ